MLISPSGFVAGLCGLPVDFSFAFHDYYKSFSGKFPPEFPFLRVICVGKLKEVAHSPDSWYHGVCKNALPNG